MIPATSADVDSVLALTFPNVTFTKSAANLASRRQFLQAGKIISYSGAGPASDCAQARGVPGSTQQNIALASKSASFATQGAQIGAEIAGATVTAIPIVGSIVQGIISIFAGISAHHAQAVANEQTVLCTVVPAVNQAFASDDDAVATGKVSLSDAFTGLDTIESQYKQAVTSILKEAPGSCNAACQVDGFVQEQIALRKLEYPNMAPAGGLLSGAVLTSYDAVKTSLTKYWPLALLAGIIILLFRRRG